jgi:hypothetical protein
MPDSNLKSVDNLKQGSLMITFVDWLDIDPLDE